MHTSPAHKTIKIDSFPERKITQYIVIHCADTPAKMDIGAAEIRKWHVQERGWKDIGYHFVIRRNGEIEKGRHHSYIGAHVEGYNSKSIGICLVGKETNYTDKQWKTLSFLVKQAVSFYKGANVVGHCDLDPVRKKFCPGFDAKAWWARECTSVSEGRKHENAA